MKFRRFALLATAATLAASAPANASIFISYALNGGAITYTGVSGATSATYTGNIGTFRVNAASGSMGLLPYLLSSSVQAEKSGGAASTLDIYITATNLAGITDILSSTFTENVLPAGWSVTESTYYDLSNNDLTGGVFTGTWMASATLTGLSTAAVPTGPLSLPGLFSITHQYHISAPVKGSSLSTISLAASAVPEPGSWALMLGGFGLAGLGLRMRAAKVRAAYAN